MLALRCAVVATLVVAGPALAASNDLLVVHGITGRSGGTLVYAQRNGPKSFNPVIASDNASREVLHRLVGDLIHINRATQLTEPALAKSWTVSPDGLHYVLELRHGVNFSDGHAFDADDVVFSFQVYLDEKVGSPQRDLLILNGKPIAVRKLDSYKVAFDLPKPYAAAERLFDGFAILPHHKLEAAYRNGKLSEAWSLSAPASDIVGLGPFRLKQFVAGERVVLERNPHYWKSDEAGTQLPYLAEIDFVLAGSEDIQVMRFQSAESDVISRVSAMNFSVLGKNQARRGYTLTDVGPGLESSVLFFNLDETAAKAGGLAYLRRESFRRAVSLAIDRDALVHLVYQGRAAAMSGLIPPGDKAWIDTKLPSIVHSIPAAKESLRADGFTWSATGSLLDPAGKPVEFSIVIGAGNTDRLQMATLIQEDLKPLGMNVHVAPLEFASLLNRVFETHDYEACILSLSEADADPNTEMAVLLSSSGNHLWHPSQKTPATAWEQEIDRLMESQMTERDHTQRKRLFDRVQEILMDKLPLIPLVSPHILTGARGELGNFRPAIMDHYALWNIEELYWRSESRR